MYHQFIKYHASGRVFLPNTRQVVLPYSWVMSQHFCKIHFVGGALGGSSLHLARRERRLKGGFNVADVLVCGFVFCESLGSRDGLLVLIGEEGRLAD